jgi:hypothetical protein
MKRANLPAPLVRDSSFRKSGKMKRWKVARLTALSSKGQRFAIAEAGNFVIILPTPFDQTPTDLRGPHRNSQNHEADG